ncbi:MAG: DNA polymerase IV [Bacillota bacterium]|nr:DNA polymerase IV [Bacillota bacterium]
MTRVIFLADMESFYASVEIASNPALKGKPVVVCGDPKLRHGIALAANKEAKACGITTGMPAWECKCQCPQVVFVRPRMGTYIEVSLAITNIFEQFSDKVMPYSIDEQFLDMTGCQELFGSPLEAARQINQKVLAETGIRCRIGIGENLLQAKMACDCFAKKSSEGIFQLTYANYPQLVWPLPIRSLFGVGSRMGRNFTNMGVLTIGSLARLPKEKLKYRWGINGEVLWLNSHGIDYATVQWETLKEHKGVGHSMTLPKDYRHRRELEVVLLELTEEVCRRARSIDKAGWVVHLSCRGESFDFPTGFSRQKKLPYASAITMDVYKYVLILLEAFWDGKPVRSVGLTLSGLVNANQLQLALFEDKVKQLNLSFTMDQIRKRFGTTSLFRASSLLAGSQLFARANKIGGHEA